MRTIFDIEKKDKEDKKAFDTQLEKEIFRYNITTDAKKADYLGRLDKDMYEAVVKATTQEAPATATPPVTGSAENGTRNIASTGEALRQERIQKVQEGRAQRVEEREEIDTKSKEYVNDYKDNLNTVILHEEQAKQQASAAKAVVFAENRNQNTSSTPTAPAQPFNVEEGVATVNFAQQMATKRKEKQQEAAQSAQREMTPGTAAVTKPDPAIAIPTATVSAPTTQAANQTPFTATGTGPAPVNA